MISLSAVVALVVYVIVLCLVGYLLLFLIDYAGVPEPFNKVLKVVLAVVGVLILISLLLSLVGSPIVRL